MKTEVIYVTPGYAKSLLAKNASFQRVASKHTVKGYAEAMKRGEWRLTHQGIATDVNGYLIDGQHRLLAVIEAGMTIPMTLFSGVPESSFSVLDIGKKRNISDLLAIPKTHSAIVNRISRDLLVIPKPSSEQAREIYTSLYDQILYSLETCGGNNKNVLTSASAQVAFIMHILENPHDINRSTNLYKNMIAFNIEALPPIGVALVSQVARGAVSAGGEAQRKDLLFRLLYTFDPSKTSINRIIITNDHMANRILEIREMTRKIVGFQ